MESRKEKILYVIICVSLTLLIAMLAYEIDTGGVIGRRSKRSRNEKTNKRSLCGDDIACNGHTVGSFSG